MRRIAVTLAAGLALAACARPSNDVAPPPAPPQPAAAPTLDPVGVYDFSTEVDGQPVSGVLSISGSPGAYTATMSSDIGNIGVRNIAVEGMRLSFIGDHPDATVFIELVFSGDSFSGEWDAGDTFGYLSGSRR
jgi:hypothetical protein